MYFSQGFFWSLFNRGYTVEAVFIGIAVAFGCGLLVMFTYLFKNERRSGTLALSFLVFPIITQGIVMMIHLNATLGVAIAISGAFTLVRFRSVPGSALDITHVFIAVTAGLSVGVGQIAFAGAVTGTTCLILIATKSTQKFWQSVSKKTGIFGNTDAKQLLSITVPDDVDYMRDFEPILSRHLISHVIVETATTQMGSLYKLKYEIRVKNQTAVNELINELRIKNSNLPISCVVIRNPEYREL
jgi:hypothetical protein